MTPIKQAVARNTQFIIAMHAPRLLALPGAQILRFADGCITPADWSTLPHVQLMRDFLGEPERFLQHQ